MAFPVGTATGSFFAAETTSHTITAPACAIGDVLVLVMGVNNWNGASTTLPAEWVQVAFGSDSEGYNYGYAWKRLVDGTESWFNGGAGGTFTCTHAANAACAGGFWRITGASGTVSGGAAGGWTASPNPPSHTPAWGAKDTLWIASYGIFGNTAYTSSPASYTFGQQNGGGAGNAGERYATAQRSRNIATEDPGLFASGTHRWVATTVAVEPASPVVATGGPIRLVGSAGVRGSDLRRVSIR